MIDTDHRLPYDGIWSDNFGRGSRILIVRMRYLEYSSSLTFVQYDCASISRYELSFTRYKRQLIASI